MRRLLPFASPAYGQSWTPPSAEDCHSAQITRPTPSRDDLQSLTLALPVTLRGVKWNMVKRLDQNASLRRSVIESNRRDLLATLSKGVCSDE
jgi:hypothetical protein